jgi:hypothetical protein
VEAFKIYQEVDLSSDLPRVNNVVDFGEEIGYLIVQAEASTESRPLEGFTPRCEAAALGGAAPCCEGARTEAAASGARDGGGCGRQ